MPARCGTSASSVRRPPFGRRRRSSFACPASKPSSAGSAVRPSHVSTCTKGCGATRRLQTSTSAVSPAACWLTVLVDDLPQPQSLQDRQQQRHRPQDLYQMLLQHRIHQRRLPLRRCPCLRHLPRPNRTHPTRHSWASRREADRAAAPTTRSAALPLGGARVQAPSPPQHARRTAQCSVPHHTAKSRLRSGAASGRCVYMVHRA